MATVIDRDLFSWGLNTKLWEKEQETWNIAESVYENVIYDRIVDSIFAILADEFHIPIYMDSHKGNQSFLLIPGDDAIIAPYMFGQDREYSVMIQYQLDSGGTYNRNTLKQVTEITERVKRLMYNNIDYTPSSIYHWNNARISTITHTRLDSILQTEMQFNCNSTEVSPN